MDLRAASRREVSYAVIDLADRHCHRIDYRHLSEILGALSPSPSTETLFRAASRKRKRMGSCVAVKDDIQVGIQGSILAPREEVLAACMRAVEVLGRHASASASSTKVSVKIFPGLVQKNVSPLVGITLAPGDNGRVNFSVRIEKYQTSQASLVFVGVGPKSLVGKSSYKNLLTALEQELAAIPNGNTSIKRIGTGH